MNRRGFLKGLISTVTASPLIKLPTAAVRKVIPYIPTRWYSSCGPLLNWGAWDSRFKTYDEAKEGSDKLAEEVIRRMFNGPK